MSRAPSRETLRTIARNQDRAIAEASSSVKAELQKTLKRFYTYALAEVRGGTLGIPQPMKLSDYLQLGSRLTELLADAGMSDLVSDYVRKFPALEREAMKYFKALGFDPSSKKFIGSINMQALDGFVSFSRSRLADLVDLRLVKPLQNAIIQNSLFTADRQTIVAGLQQFIDLRVINTPSGNEYTDAQVSALVDETLTQYTRHVTAQVGDDLGMEFGVFDGPDDGKTSEVCQALLAVDRYGVPGLLSMEEWDDTEALNSYLSDHGVPDSQLLTAPVRQQGGHFNCRHRIFRLTREAAQNEGADV